MKEESLRNVSEQISIGLLKNPLILFLFICGIGYIGIKYVPTIIKIIKLEIKRKKEKK